MAIILVSQDAFHRFQIGRRNRYAPRQHAGDHPAYSPGRRAAPTGASLASLTVQRLEREERPDNLLG